MEVPAWLWYVLVSLGVLWALSLLKRTIMSWQAHALNAQGIRLYSQGLIADSVRVFENAVNTFPRTAFLRVSLSKVLMDQGRYSRATHHLETALNMPAEAATHQAALVNLAGIQYAQKHFSQAVDCLERALKDYTEDYETLFNLGAALEQLGEWEQAFTVFQRSNALFGNDRARLGLARMAQMLSTNPGMDRILEAYDGFVMRPPTCKPIPLTPAEMKSLQGVIQTNDALVFLAGAGISYPLPAGMPLAGQVLSAVFHFLYELDFKELNRIAGQTTEDAVYAHLCKSLSPDTQKGRETLPFLATFQVLHDLYGTPALRFVDLLDGGQPNLHHYMLAHALHCGHTVVTANFDQLIEKAHHILFDQPPTVILVTDADYQSALDTKRSAGVLAKIHGDKDDYNSLALTLEGTAAHTDTTLILEDDITPDKGRQQAQRMYPRTSLSIPKSLFLQHLLQNGKLIIQGYSGSDTFDIMPILNVTDLGARGVWVVQEPRQPRKGTDADVWAGVGNDRVVLQPKAPGSDLTSSVSLHFLNEFGGTWSGASESRDGDAQFSDSFTAWIKRLRMRPGDGLNFAARLHSQRGMLAEAQRYYEASLGEYDRARGDAEKRWLVTKGNYATVLNNLGKADQAVALNGEILTHLETTGRDGLYPDVYANTLLNVSLQWINTTHDPQAADYFERAMKIAQSIQDKRLLLFGLRIAATRSYRKGQYREALEVFSRVLEIAINLHGDVREAYEASMGAGMSLIMLGRQYDAMEMFSHAEEYASILSDAGLLEAARVKRQSVGGRFQGESGVPLHQQLMQSAREKIGDPARLDTLLEYMQHQRYDLCLELLDRLQTQHRDPDVQALLLFIRSNVCYRMDDLEGNLAALTQFTRVRPDHPLCEHNLGVVHRKQKKYKPAERHFLRAIELMNGNYPLARCNLGLMYADLGRLKQARKQLAIAEATEPDLSSVEDLRRRIIELEGATVTGGGTA